MCHLDQVILFSKGIYKFGNFLGLYVFHLVIKGHPSGTGGMAAIMVNLKVIQKAQAQSNYAQSSASVVVELAAGDQVYARLQDGGLWSNANNYLHFTGYLLYEV